ncbi:MAG: alpha/beta hydrolase family protein [Gemmatimonadales bacterium]
MRTIALACALAAGIAARGAAQETDAGILRLYQGPAELGREVFSDNGRVFESSVSIPVLNIKIVSRLERTETGAPIRTEMRVYDLGADTLQRTYQAVLDRDTMRMTLSPAGGQPRSWAKRFTPDVIAADQNMSLYLWLVQRSRGRERTWHVFLPNADSVLDMHLTWRGDSADVTLGPQSLVMVLGADGRVSSVDIPVGRVHYDRFRGGQITELPPMRGLVRPVPDYFAPAGAAYTAEEVRVPVHPARGDTFSLGCTLTKPQGGAARAPAAITLTGSGLQDRDENLWPLLSAYHLFRQVAERLAQAGIAVLRCDDHGFGSSGGSLDSVTMVDFAADAAAQLAWLRSRRDIDGAHLAVIGHSEGGIVGPMVAADDRQLAALVVMAGTGKTMRLVVRDQFLYPVERAQGLTDVQRDTARAQALRGAEEFINSPLPYLRQAKDYDPLPTARRVRAPVLIVQGALDRQVSAGQADTLAAAMRGAGNRDVTVRKFEGLNHLFLRSPSGTGAPDEYASLTDAAVPADVLDTIATWLAARLRR